MLFWPQKFQVRTMGLQLGILPDHQNWDMNHMEVDGVPHVWFMWLLHGPRERFLHPFLSSVRV